MRKALPFLTALAMLGGCAAPQLSAPAAAPPDRQAEAFSTYLSARFAGSDHDLSQAERYYGASLKNDPDNSELLALAFYFAATSGDLDAAGKYAQQVVTKAGNDNSARLTLAVLALKQKDYAESRRQLAASAKNPLSALTVSVVDAWAAAASGDAAGAAADMKTLAAQTGAEGIAAFQAALIADYMGQKDAADAFYKKALSINPNVLRVIEAYGNYLERMGRDGDATALYQRSVGNPALEPVAEPALARIAAKKKPEPMIRSAEDGAADGLCWIAGSFSDQNSAEVSIFYLRMALYLRPDFGLAQYYLGSRFETLRRFDDAVAVFAQVDKASPYYSMAAVEAAVDQSRLNKKDEAIKQLRSLAQIRPGDSETWIALGDAYRDADRNDEAIDAYTRAEKAIGTPAKRDWPLFYARAMAEDKARHWDRAEADLDLALKLSPEQPELLNYLGYSWVDQNKRIPEALTMLEKARTLRPYDGYIIDSVGWAYYRLGRYNEAATTLEAAVLLVPGDSTINDHLGDALWKAGRKMEARFQWNHALAFSADDGEKATIAQKLKSGLTG